MEFFGDRAKEFLDLELDCPRVATVQALVILSSHEIGNGNDARGWLYSGTYYTTSVRCGLDSHVQVWLYDLPLTWLCISTCLVMFPMGSSLPLMRSYAELSSGLLTQLTSEYFKLYIPALDSESDTM